jgi:8-oxo-dGTP pyrophosphatase MutT (NUDIX family)
MPNLINLEDKLKDALSRRVKQRVIDSSRWPSAVLIPIYRLQDQYYIVFTRRTDKVKYHKGEISFPGGAYHKEDGTLLQTALRESFEEVGLRPEDVTVAGELDDIPTMISNYVISPFVGFIPPGYRFILNDFEAAELIEVPLSALLEKDSLVMGLPERQFEKWVPSYFYHYHDTIIHGATARILTQLLGILSGLAG